MADQAAASRALTVDQNDDGNMAVKASRMETTFPLRAFHIDFDNLELATLRRQPIA